MSEFDKCSRTSLNLPVSASVTATRQEYVRNASRLVNLFEKGLDKSTEIVGWHGTSLEAIQQALITGTFPGSAIPHGEAKVGHIFYFPYDPNNSDEAVGISGAKRYATTNAEVAFIIRQLKLDISNPNVHSLVRIANDHILTYEPEGDKAIAQLCNMGVKETELKSTCRLSRQCKGVLIAISRTALEHHASTDGDVVGQDKKLYVPQGLSLDDLAGIEPLGEKEFEYFEELQRSLGR